MYAELKRKKCFKCKEEKSHDDFRLRKKGKNYKYESYCRACEKIDFKKWYARNKVYQRERDFKRNCFKFGLTAEEYRAMVEIQNNKCAICLKPETNTRGGIIKNLAIDHCHTTGKIRSLLCNGCNTAIGLFKEDINTVKSALKYLTKFKK